MTGDDTTNVGWRAARDVFARDARSPLFDTMWKTEEGSTGRLVQLCIGYFFFYVVTGVSVKYFQGKGMSDIEYNVYSTAAGTCICLSVTFAKGWYKLESSQPTKLLGRTFAGELLYIIPSGICTAVVIPTTTLMYSLKGVSVMVAMVIMRGAVIVLSRLVDEIQIRKGILKKRVYREENLGVAFAISAVALTLFFSKSGEAETPFYKSVAAMTILGSYVTAYAIRIYIMNYFKNTRPPGVKLDNQGFLGNEQISASATLLVLAVVLYNAPKWFGATAPQIHQFIGAIDHPRPDWSWAFLSGTSFGIVAFFSVFIFMFKGRTATFAGLVNRLTSLVAGTTSTLFVWALLGGKPPKVHDWGALALIFVAVYFLTRAEKRRAAELKVTV